MRSVGARVAQQAISLLGGSYGKRVVLEVGPGNNGADGLACAAVLTGRGVKVDIVRVGETVGQQRLAAADLFIDAAFGVGLSRPFACRSLPSELSVLSIDLPSGIDASTGAELGSAYHATRTVAVGALKPGHLQGAGISHSGEIVVELAELAPRNDFLGLVDDDDLVSWIPIGQRSDHKWKRSVMVVAGAPGTFGAAVLSSRAAYRLSCGIVHLFLHSGEAAASSAVLNDAPEIVVRPLESLWAEPIVSEIERFRALVVGPGVGRNIQMVNFVRRLVARSSVPTVVDAEGLSAFGDVDRLKRAVEGGDREVILTPHDGEFNALFGSSGLRSGDDADRITLCRDAARLSGCTVLLKGSPTVIARPDGVTRVVASGSAALAMAGSGDVLAGMIGGFLARGLDALSAASAAAHLHGRAGTSGGRYSSDPLVLVERAVGTLERLQDEWHRSQPAVRTTIESRSLPSWTTLE